MIGIGIGIGFSRRSIWTPASLSSAKVLRWAEARALTDLATGSTAGSGTPTSGGTAGFFTDRSGNADAFIQATSGRRPVVKTHTLGRGVAIHGSGGAGAGGNYLATGSTVAGIKYLWLVATVVGADVTRGAGALPSGAFIDDYHGFAGTSVIATSAVLLTGQTGQNIWGQNSLSAYTRDGTSVTVSAADVGWHRKRTVFRVTHTSAADTGNLNLLRHVGFDGYYARGAIHAVIAGSSSLTAGELALIDSYLASYWLAGGLVVVTGDSLMAGYGLLETQGVGAILHEGYNRCVSLPTIAVPGQGVGSSISPLTDTLLTTDAAKLSAIKGSHSPAVLVALCGTNDLANSRTSAQLLSDLQTYTAARKAEGWRVIVGTIAPRTKDTDGITAWPAGKETQRTTFNTAIRADHSWADGFVDVDTIAPGLAADGIHWTSAGTASVAAAIKTVTDTLLA